MQAAVRKARPAQKQQHAATTSQPTSQELYQKHIEQEIANLKEDVYTRATWKKLQEVKEQADENAGKMKIIMLSAGGIGFVLGAVVTFLFARRMGGREEGYKIT
jgi:hypothetical protein